MIRYSSWKYVNTWFITKYPWKFFDNVYSFSNCSFDTIIFFIFTSPIHKEWRAISWGQMDNAFLSWLSRLCYLFSHGEHRYYLVTLIWGNMVLIEFWGALRILILIDFLTFYDRVPWSFFTVDLGRQGLMEVGED